MKLIAHRGNNNSYFENTLSSINKSLNTLYIDGVEFDIRITQDNEFVVFHDGILNFKSDGFGFVKDKKLSKIKKYHLNNGDNIITLDELLSNISTSKIIMIEIKDSDIKVCDILYEVIKKYNFDFYIISFHYDVLRYFKDNYPMYKVGILIAFLLNIKYFHNDFDFNIVEYSYYKRISKKKEAFIFNVDSKLKRDNIYNYCNDFNVITDYSYLLK